MIEITVPGIRDYKLEHLVLDLNGTIALDGEVVPGVEERLRHLSKLLSISIVTADTHGSAQWLGQYLPLRIHIIEEGKEAAQKLALVQQRGEGHTVCIGNGSNDVSMLKEAALGICVMGGEGASPEAIMSSDLVVYNINDALGLPLKPDRLVATLRR